MNEKTGGELWLKVDPFILHIGCETLEGANTILAAMRRAGVKRGGIILASPGKFIIELQGTEKMGVPVKSGAKIFADEKYLGYLLEKANKLVSKNYARLERLESEFRKSLA